MLSTLIWRIDRRLEGAPDELLTVVLFGLAALLVLIAIRGKPFGKALAVAWVMFP